MGSNINKNLVSNLIWIIECWFTIWVNGFAFTFCFCLILEFRKNKSARFLIIFLSFPHSALMSRFVMYSETCRLKCPSLPLKARRHPLLNIDGARLCTLVDIGSIFSTSVQGTYFYQVIFGTNFKNFWEPKHP